MERKEGEGERREERVERKEGEGERREERVERKEGEGERREERVERREGEGERREERGRVRGEKRGWDNSGQSQNHSVCLVSHTPKLDTDISS